MKNFSHKFNAIEILHFSPFTYFPVYLKSSILKEENGRV